MTPTYALHADLYQLTMLASYFHRGMHETPAQCEMFVRRLPKNRKFLVAAGLDQGLQMLQNLRFTDAQIESLKEVPGLKEAMSYDFVEYLRGFRFRGTVHAVPEGTVLFENEPFLRVEADLASAQLVETFLLSALNHQTNIASKAARVVLAAKERSVMEFGTRRTHPHAAVDVARAAYIAGFSGTSNVEAFERYGVPARGTMAHMYVMASDDEEQAFKAYGDLYNKSTFLIDTYDTMRGLDRAVETLGDNMSAVRIDSGDLAVMSKKVRARLKELGREDIKIVLSSDLDEYALEDLEVNGDYDAAGVGTRIATCDDAPSLGGVYKLVQIGERMVAKFSESKVTYPGAHQIYRHEKGGVFDFDHLGMVGEKSYPFIDAEELLICVMKDGVRLHQESIHDMRARCRQQIAKLPAKLREIGLRIDEREHLFEVRASDSLLKALEKCREEMNPL
ncbi:MAG: nicotinate phosphoribosyltransferase [Deltaproteobacteria bacterium]|nr:nicotinate phosphoribosyltransferase [Deltaproteobacteria bacterium]